MKDTKRRIEEQYDNSIIKATKPSSEVVSSVKIKEMVRQRYGQVAKSKTSAGCRGTSCCSPAARDYSKFIGYREEEITAVPEGSNLGFGCGNPVALALLEEGQTVLDLGSGAGFDAFLAARAVGENGRVIGVDMTPEMIDRARDNARRDGYANVEFRLGEIENLPAADESVDVVISNCVINLSPEKERVFREAHRVLRRGGRLVVSDIVLKKPLPEAIRKDVEAYIGCIAGASLRSDYLSLIAEAGFEEVEVLETTGFPIGGETLKQLAEQIPAGRNALEKLEGIDLVEAARSIESITISAGK